MLISTPLAITIGILLGLIAGGLAAYLYFNARQNKYLAELSRLGGEREGMVGQLAQAKEDLRKAQEAYHGREDQILRLTADLSRMGADYQNLTHRMTEREQEVNELQVKFQGDFDSLANRIFEHSTQKLSSHNKEQLAQMLEPLKEKIQSFEQKVTDAYEKESRERFHLQKEIEQLSQLNLRMSEEAQNLTRALKGDQKAQGNWGEMVLSRVLENSGLREGIEFTTQARDLGLKDESGRVQQPDVIVNLPDNKHIIIDAKVSLTAYESLLGTEEDEMRSAFIKQHLTSVRQHIQGLSEKHYQANPSLNSPDFVLLFMPIEAAFSTAIQAQPDLFSRAWERKIVVVSPTTLLASLRTIASIWKVERQNQNAMEIARQGGALYDKFASFVTDMDKIGKHLDQATRTHEDAMKKLKDGRGSLANRAEKLRELGIKNRKKLE